MKLKKARNALIVFFLGVLPSTSYSGEAPVDSVSEHYSYLADDNEARMLFTSGQMDKLKNSLLQSKNFKAVSKLLRPLYEGERTRKTLKRDAHQNIAWIDHGIEKQSEIVLIDTTGSLPNQEIFSNFQEGIGVADIIIDFTVSPDGRYVDIVSSEYGSIDQVECFVVEVDTHEVVAVLHLAGNQRAWNSNATLLYNKLVDDGTQSFALANFTNKSETPFNGAVIASNSDVVLLENFSEQVNWYSIQNKADGSIVNFDWPESLSPQLIGNDDNQVYFLTYDNGEQASEIIKAQRHQSVDSRKVLSQKPEVLAKEPSVFLEKAWFDKDAIFAQVRAGADRWIRIYSTEGKRLAQFAVPDCCSVRDAAWVEPGLSVTMNLTSPLFSTLSFIYRLNNLKWDEDPNLTMLNDRDLHLVSEVIYSTSKDATKIPSRMVHLRNLAADSSHPVEIESYGGFGLAGYADPAFDPSVLEFIKRGGIFIGTALRGGNEFGPAWHKQAMLTNKIKTYEDLASLSDFLVSEKWTTPRLIVSRGTSNGGLTVAATGLLFPDKFGLIIPIAGVHDLLAKDFLDSVNQGWSDEYGSVLSSSVFLRTISPVENASRMGGVKYLIIDGASDTRVNPVHSVKFAKALEDLGGNNSQVHLLTMQNAGHWLESVSYQNTIGLQTEIIIWTEIFDLAGLSFAPTHFARDFDGGRH